MAWNMVLLLIWKIYIRYGVRYVKWLSIDDTEVSLGYIMTRILMASVTEARRTARCAHILQQDSFIADESVLHLLIASFRQYTGS